MKASFRREPLLAACAAVFPFAAKKSTVEVIKNVKIISDGLGITLVATDNETTIRKKCSVLSTEEGMAILPWKAFNILKESNSDEVVIDADEGTCRIELSNGSFELNSVHVSSFPDSNPSDFTRAIMVEAEDFIRMVKSASIAVSQLDKTNTVQRGINVRLQDKRLSMIGFDGRVACFTGVDGDFDGKASVTVPPKPLELAAGMAFGQMLLNPFLPNAFAIKGGSWEIRTLLYEGTFMDVQKATAKLKSSFEAKINVGQFASLLRQASLVTDDLSVSVILSFTPNKLSVTSSCASHGRSALEMVCECAGSSTTRMNPKFWLAFLDTLDDDAVMEYKFDGKQAIATCGNVVFLISSMEIQKGS